MDEGSVPTKFLDVGNVQTHADIPDTVSGYREVGIFFSVGDGGR